MKIAHLFILVAMTLCVGFLVARLSQAQPSGRTVSERATTNNDIAFQEIESLVNYLHDTGQTNALKQLNRYLANERALQDDANLSLTVAILQNLRDGKTNEVLEFLERHLDSQISVFSSEYRALPIELQKQMSLKPLQRARDYRVKYPFKNSDPYWGKSITNAFRILDDK